DWEENFEAGIRHNIEIGVGNVAHLDQVAAAAEKLGLTAKVHLKVDTGLSRNGVALSAWPHVIRAVQDLTKRGHLEVVGIFSHLSTTSAEDDLKQIELFEDAVSAANEAGVNFKIRHLTASDGSLNYKQAHYDMVRLGVSLYGLSPWTDHTSADYGLVPAMTAKATVINVKAVPAGQGVSYGYSYRTSRATKLALVPVGYAEGLPRNASGKAEVSINGHKFPILARIAMDQFVIDIDETNVKPGDEVVIFGDPATGVPSADQLAIAAGTINYEIVTRMGGRFKRSYIGEVD
ncbi:MAG: alanine racemase, partial [Micrococcales bacterium]